MDTIYNVLLRPIVTEKSMKAQSLGKYTFVISSNATKIDVQKAVELRYSVKVEGVNVMPVRKKVRLIGRTKQHTKRQAEKRAVVTLKKGQTLDIMNIAEAA